MSVENTHPDYDEMLEEWELVSACCSGHKKVKRLGTKVLPAPSSDDQGSYDKRAYKSYMDRAVYVNFTGRTRDGLVGAAFRTPQEVDLSIELDYMISNPDGSGQPLEQFSKEVLSSLFCSGREIILSDYPHSETGLSSEEVGQDGAVAYISRYSCTSLINWKTKKTASGEKIVLAVLKESYDSSDDEFSCDKKTQYRVLRLIDDVYSQQIYLQDESLNDSGRVAFVGLDPVFPTKHDGSYFDEIPMVVIGSVNNDANVDPIPLSDIAHVNLGHFRNSADLEENCFIHSQLTIGITSDLSYENFKAANPNGIVVGAKSGHFLGGSGGFSSVQAGPNQLADALMERKEEQMRKLGAKMIEQRAGNQTAEAARIDATGESSVLSDMVGNVEAGIRKCLFWCGEFMGADVDDSDFVMNRQFFDESVDPQKVMVAIQLNDRGVIADKDLRDLSRKSGIIDPDRTDEEIEGEAEAADPMVGVAEVER